MVLKEVSFDKSPFWVQFHNLPLGILEGEENVQNMGNMIGELVWYEKPKVQERFIRSYGSARVLINVNHPLVAGFWMDRPDKSEVWVSVKYERLLSFCYKCGMLGHDFKMCSKEIAKDDRGNDYLGRASCPCRERL